MDCAATRLSVTGPGPRVGTTTTNLARLLEGEVLAGETPLAAPRLPRHGSCSEGQPASRASWQTAYVCAYPGSPSGPAGLAEVRAVLSIWLPAVRVEGERPARCRPPR